MDQTIWIMVGLLGTGLVIGYLLQTADSRKLTQLLQQQALQRNGTVKPGSLISFPRLVFPYGDTTIQVSVLAGSSPLTWADFSINLPGKSVKIRNRSTRVLTQKALGLMQVLRTEDSYFDQRFFVETNDEPLVVDLLSAELRDQLLNLDTAYGQHGILIRLEQNQFQISIDTFGREAQLFADIIDTALIFYDRLIDM